MKPKIFISYTGREALGRQSSKELFGELEGAEFTALRDKERLDHGDLWHDGLDSMLNECHGAVILLSPEVSNSDWVRREATILSHRKRVCDDFVLLPVLLGEATEAQFTGLGLDDLSPFQHATVSRMAELLANGGELIQLRDRFRVANPEHELQIRIAASLRRSQWERLIALAKQLEIDVGAWAVESSLSGVLARHIAAELPNLANTSLVRVVRAMNHVFSDLGRDTCKEVLGLLASSWVPVSAARQLREADFRGGKCFALNSNEEWTQRMYLRRARGLGAAWKSLSALGVDGGEDELAMIEEELRAEWNSQALGDWARRQDMLDKLREPVFALIRSLACDDDLQQLLTHNCTGLNFLLADQSLHAAAVKESFPHARFLAPELEPDKERCQRENYNLAKQEFNRLVADFRSDDL